MSYTKIEDLPIPIHEAFLNFETIIEGKDKIIELLEKQTKLLEDRCALLEERMGLMKILMEEVGIDYE